MATHAVNWELDSLFPHPATPEFAGIIEQLKVSLTRLAASADALAPPREPSSAVVVWKTLLQDLERLEALYADLNSFIGCHQAADAGNVVLRQLEASLAVLVPLRERIATSVEFAVRDLTDAEFDRFVAADPALQRIEFHLAQRRINARLRLPRAEELLAADLAVDGLHAWGRLFNRLSGDLRVQVMERGELVEKSPGQIKFDSPERSVRQNNFHASAKAWKGIADSCADAINHIAGSRLTVYRRAGLADHLDVPLRRNRLRRETLDSMWSAVAARKSMLGDYLTAKARLMGLSRPSWYDLHAPLPGGEAAARQSISFDTGVEMVIDSFQAFSGDMADFARHALAQRWVEAEDRSGKRQGAFSTDFPTHRQSRVFMTYLGSEVDVAILAHELGHAYHTWVLRKQPYFLQEYPMNLAETASTFAEAVLAEERLRRSTSRHERLAILDRMLSDAVSYLMNIHARFLFEDRFHRERAGGELSAARLSELMLAAQKEAYLNTLADDGWYPDLWVSKLHFYISDLPFYNFPYTFGFLLSTGLFSLGQDGARDFPERYCRLLVATGCLETEAAVKATFDCDLAGPDFWNRSLDVVERRVRQFLELVTA